MDSFTSLEMNMVIVDRPLSTGIIKRKKQDLAPRFATDRMVERCERAMRTLLGHDPPIIRNRMADGAR